MKVLLDHCVPKRFRNLLADHSVSTAREMGWDALKNGEFLSAAEAQFDVVLTVDTKLKHQQNLATLPISVVVLIAPTNRYEDLAPLAPLVVQHLTTLKPKAYIEIRLP